MADFKFLGFSDDYTACDKCGRSELKGTYAIQTNTGDLFRLGSSCIKKAYQLTTKEYTAILNADIKEAAQKFYDEYQVRVQPLNEIMRAYDFTTVENQNAWDAEKALIAELKLKYPLAPNSATHSRPN